MSKRPAVVLASALATGLVAAGCGGGGDSTSTSTATVAPLTKAEFVKQADAVCAKSRKQAAADLRRMVQNGELTAKSTEAQSTKVAETILIPAINEEVDAVRALGSPSGEEDRVDAIFDAVEESVGRVEDDPGALLTSGENPFAEANKLSREYGFKKCGQE